MWTRTIATVFVVAASVPLAYADTYGNNPSSLQSKIDHRYLNFQGLTGSICGCKLLSELSSDEVYYPNTTTYTNEQSHFWSATTRLLPRCVFVPTTSSDVALGLLVAKKCKADFAVRGEGHMPVPGAASSDGGILFAMSALNKVELTPGGQSVQIGPGNTWGNVYNYLAKSGLYCLGGRLGIVGVPGLLLGGGLNYFSNKYGFAMDNILSAEVVLASGEIVKATASNSYKDLLWALKGGSGQFGVVTNFELKTFKVPQVWSGLSLFAADPTGPVFDTFYSAIVNLTNSGYTDRGAGVIAQVQYTSQGADKPPFIGGMGVFMHEGSETDPKIFSEFKKVPWLPPVIPYNITSPAFLPAAISGSSSSDDRYLFLTGASVATTEALKIMHSIFYSMASKLSATVPSLTSSRVALQPIPASTIAYGKSDADNFRGNTFGLKQGESQCWYCLSIGWKNAGEDEAANKWAAEFGNALVTELGKKGLLSNDGRGFEYMNDAQGGQDVFSKYGKKELKKLREVRDKYDPRGEVFGKNGLAKGGFKF